MLIELTLNQSAIEKVRLASPFFNGNPESRSASAIVILSFVACTNAPLQAPSLKLTRSSATPEFVKVFPPFESAVKAPDSIRHKAIQFASPQKSFAIFHSYRAQGLFRSLL